MGSAIGSVVGGIAGSAFPVVGTALGSTLGGAVGGLLGGSQSSSDMQNRAIQSGQMSYDQARALGTEAANMAKFKPYGITSNIGSFNVSDTGNATMGLSPQQQAYENQLNQQAMTFTGINPRVDPQGLFSAMQAVRDPINQRNQLALEQRQAAQGTLGLGSAMYGGANPQQFAMQQAMQEQLSQDALTSMTQANQLTQQGLANQQSALGLSYTPQSQLMNLSKFGYDLGGQYNQSLQNQGSLFSGAGIQGLPALSRGYENAADIAANQARTDAGLWGTVGQSVGGLFGSGKMSDMFGGWGDAGASQAKAIGASYW
jgi:hypothetical protein